MSGGAFDYAYFKIEEFASELKERIDNNNKADEFGFVDDYKEETVDLLNKALKHIDLCGKLAKEIEYLYSGDSSEEIFNENVKVLFDV